MNINPPNVYILTWCQEMPALYGNTLIFKTLRTGFPNARITVIDNNSLTDARLEISRLAKENECSFLPLYSNVSHHEFVEYVINTAAGNVVFLDPDVIFWKNVEDWNFSGYLMAGRLLPRFQDPVSVSITEPRLHTSFLWVPSCEALRERISQIRKVVCKERDNEFEPVKPLMLYDPDNKTWRRFDTMGMLYGAIKDETYSFNEKELNSYEHLFCGTHYSLVRDDLDAEGKDILSKTHDLSKTDYHELRGIWREQEKYFNDRGL